MELGVARTSPATPGLPCPPRPPGQLTAVEAPILSFHSALTLERKSTNVNVVPEPSERWTVVIWLPGRVTPGFSAATAGSFQDLIFSRKMSASTGPVKRSGALTPGRL